MIARARHMWRPLEVNEDNLALQVIDDVARASVKGEGPTVYLTHPHTARNFRRSLYVAPPFIDRSTINFEKAEETLLDRLAKKVQNILTSEPPESTIPAALVEELRAFK